MTKEEFIGRFQEHVSENPQQVPYAYAEKFIRHRGPSCLGNSQGVTEMTASLGTPVEVLSSRPSSYTPPRVVTQAALISGVWVLGGMAGGNCWTSDGPNIAVPSEDAPIFFPQLCDELYPEIPYRAVIRLQNLCKTFEFTQQEYYGNYTLYAFRVLRLEDMLEVLFPNS